MYLVYLETPINTLLAICTVHINTSCNLLIEQVENHFILTESVICYLFLSTDAIFILFMISHVSINTGTYEELSEGYWNEKSVRVVSGECKRVRRGKGNEVC